MHLFFANGCQCQVCFDICGGDRCRIPYYKPWSDTLGVNCYALQFKSRVKVSKHESLEALKYMRIVKRKITLLEDALKITMIRFVLIFVHKTDVEYKQ